MKTLTLKIFKGLAVLAAVAVLGPGSAQAAEVALSVGQTKVVSVAGASRVVVSDPDVVKVRVLRGAGVALEGKATGRAEVRIMAGGSEVELRLNVLQAGAQLVSLGTGG